MLLLEDDINFIHASRHPKGSETSTIWHMSTALADIHPQIRALCADCYTKNRHRQVPMQMPDGSIHLSGGIDTQHLLGFLKVQLLQYFCGSLLSQLPERFRQCNMSDVVDSFEKLILVSLSGI